MIITKEEREKLETLARPLIEFLNNNNYHPYVAIIVTSSGVKMTEEFVSLVIEDYIKD